MDTYNTDKASRILRTLIAARKLKQADIAEHIGCTAANLSNFLCGRKNIGIEFYLEALNYCGFDLEKNIFSQLLPPTSKDEQIDRDLSLIKTIFENIEPQIKNQIIFNIASYAMHSKNESAKDAGNKIGQAIKS